MVYIYEFEDLLGGAARIVFRSVGNAQSIRSQLNAIVSHYQTQYRNLSIKGYPYSDAMKHNGWTVIATWNRKRGLKTTYDNDVELRKWLRKEHY
jgi:hypothetical protein